MVSAVTPEIAELEGDRSRAEPYGIERTLEELAERARAFARLAVRDKQALLRRTRPALASAAPALADAASRCKGTPAAREAWTGTFAVLRYARLLERALGDIARFGKPALPRRSVVARRDGRVEVALAALGGSDALVFGGARASLLLAPGADANDLRQARAYVAPNAEGAVALVVGGREGASLAPMAVLHQLFVEGRVVALAMAEPSESLAAALERAFAPLVEAGVLRLLAVERELALSAARHPAVAHVHVLGSEELLERVVREAGASDPDASEVGLARAPSRSITSELGGVSPTIVVPHLYASDDLDRFARSIATQVASAASLGPAASVVLVTAASWPQRNLLLVRTAQALASFAPPARDAATAERFAGFLEAYPGAFRAGSGLEGAPPFTLVAGLDPLAGEPLLRADHGWPVLAEVVLPLSDPLELLAEATRFCRERLSGSLAASVMVEAAHEEDPALAQALESALLGLPFGTVVVNAAPALAYAAGSLPWGGHPSSTLQRPKSGIGFVHDAFMLEGVEKVVVRAPLGGWPPPACVAGDERAARIGPRLASHAAAPSLRSALAIALGR